VSIKGAPTLRAVIRDQTDAAVVHLLNLNVQRLSSFDDKVNPARDVHMEVRVPFAGVGRVEAITADEGATRGEVPFGFKREDDGGVVTLDVQRVDVSTMLVIRKAEGNR
jgi:hypothetical protein